MAAGFVREICVRDGAVRVGFESRTRRMDKAAAIEEGIRRAVSSLPGVERIEIRHIGFEVDRTPEIGRNPGSAGKGSGRSMVGDALR